MSSAHAQNKVAALGAHKNKLHRY